MPRAPILLLTLSMGWGVPLAAQLPDWVNQILTAAQLPVVTAEARQEGVPSGELSAVLDAMKSASVPAHEATAVIDTARAVRRDHGPVDNFGAFVQAQLASGKRGRALAAAIRAEHARVGKGKGNVSRGPGQNRGRPGGDDDDDSIRGRRDNDSVKARGRPEAAGQKQNRGRGNPRPNR